jgi:diguanylate cyclase (GGDEF)-like protein
MTIHRILATSENPEDVTGGNSELLKAQYHAIARQLPLMYLILLSNTWAVATTHLEHAPQWLAVGLPALLTGVIIMRVRHWWKSRNADPTPAEAREAFRRVNYIAFGLVSSLVIWSFLLFEYGDAYTQSHLAFYMAMTMVSCLFALMHLLSAALIVSAVFNVAFVAFFLGTGQPTFIASAINAALISIGMLAVITVNQRDFVRMVNAQIKARRTHEDQSLLLQMIDKMPVAVMTIDPTSLKISYANETSRKLIRSVEHLLPIKVDDLVGASMDIFHSKPEHQHRILSNPANLPFNGRMQLGPEILEVKVSAIAGDDGTYLGPMLTWAIVTQEIAAEKRIHQLAHYDTLTGLPNRVTFYEDLTNALAGRDNRMCLLYIDLDGFKLINDTRGHPVGDIMLREVANRLRSICNDPTMKIGRLGGDEFAVLLTGNDANSAIELSQRIIDALSTPYNFDYDKTIHIGATIGIAIAPEHGTDAEALLGRADLALYAAKANGKRQLRIFDPEMEARVHDRMQLEALLRDTLETMAGLFVFYQPIVNAKTGKITAREALIRWHHPDRGWISPATFIPLAEQSNLIDPLGEFVLEQACQDAAERGDGVRVAVNISASQIGKGMLAPAVQSALTRSGLSPDQLEIEITETAIITAQEAIMDDLSALRAIGVRIALDDFGTGYSSLSHLRMFHFDKIKIDGSFVKEAVNRPESAAVVRVIADLGKRLGVTTVAEGVETQEQLDCVREEGCTEIQGYLFGQPEPNDRDAPIVAKLNQAAPHTAPRRKNTAAEPLSETAL